MPLLILGVFGLAIRCPFKRGLNIFKRHAENIIVLVFSVGVGFFGWMVWRVKHALDIGLVFQGLDHNTEHMDFIA